MESELGRDGIAFGSGGGGGRGHGGLGGTEEDLLLLAGDCAAENTSSIGSEEGVHDGGGLLLASWGVEEIAVGACSWILVCERKKDVVDGWAPPRVRFGFWIFGWHFQFGHAARSVRVLARQDFSFFFFFFVPFCCVCV